MTMPVRVPDPLFQSAKSAGAVNSRSAAQQIDHWARIGRELESSGQISQRDVERVLAGAADYDHLTDREQSVVRAEWDERVAARIDGLDLARRFAAAGETYSEADASGQVTVHRPSGRGAQAD